MSTETFTPSSLDAESEMLPQDPPPRIIRFIAQWLMAVFAVGLLAAIFVQLPETEQAPFVLLPHNGADPIQSPRLATLSHVAFPRGKLFQPEWNYLSCGPTKSASSTHNCAR